jgi:hypothetical protein
MNQGISQSTQVFSRTGIITSAGTLLVENLYRKTLIIQNLGTNPLYVKLGDSASTSDFDFVLKGGTGADDGTGGIFSEDTLSYTGIITIAGSSPRCTATEL